MHTCACGAYVPETFAVLYVTISPAFHLFEKAIAAKTVSA